VDLKYPSTLEISSNLRKVDKSYLATALAVVEQGDGDLEDRSRLTNDLCSWWPPMRS